MKKIFFVWLLALVSILGYAQNLTEHMSFMGIPINGTITTEGFRGRLVQGVYFR